MSVLFETSLGTFVIDLYTNERPKCCLNFIKLCLMKQYNFCIFHSVQKNLVAQTGDPSGTGRGGSSVYQFLYGEQARYFDSERKPKISHLRRGLVSMVDNGGGQHGSQFFITLADQLDYLDKKHTVFGQLAEGFEFLDQINEAHCDKTNRPYRNIRIHHTIVLDDPFPTPSVLEIPQSPLRCPISSFGEVGPPRIEEDEELDETVNLLPSELKELNADQEAKTNAQLLTLIGDLPDADVRPPDNVLFVCRLNAVTNSEDLEIIFSRFGPIKSCDVIRDKRTGASLQYAFIEFENEADCENAFFKMDKVVIDDRRIHVDFSQSVAKQWNQFHRDQRAGRTYSKPASPHKPAPDRNQSYSRSQKSHNLPSVRDERSSHKRKDYSEHQRHSQSRSKASNEEKHHPRHVAELDVVVSGTDEDSSSDYDSDRGEKKRRKHDRSNHSPSTAGSKHKKHRHDHHQSRHDKHRKHKHDHRR